MIGRTLSHYRIVESLGSGGMGTVFRADDTLLGRAVALKFPHRDLVADAHGRARFLREARIASVLDHPNIVTLYDVCEVEDQVFLAMQCVPGRSLRERMRPGPVPLPEALSIGRAVADALAHAHERGVVHRDIKPENILLSDDGRVKVADFGTARHAGATPLTQTGVLMGSIEYLAPEVVHGKPAEPRSDLYSLGVVLYEMCAGATPFHGSEPAAVLYRAVHEEAAPLPASAGAPPELRHLVRSLLAKQLHERPTSAVEVADVLLQIAEHKPASGAGGASAAAPPVRSIAVLDFENLTRNPEDDYFCVGITEDIVTDLLKIPDLKVASRSAAASLRGQPLDVRQAGRALGAATLLQGSLRRAGGRIRVSAQLVRTDTAYALWAERYDRSLEDIFEVQDDISRQIAGALRLAFEPADADARLGRRTHSVRAYDLRLQALAHYRRFDEADMRQAIAVLEAALREDPDYALARADLAECCVQMFCKGWDLAPSWLDRAEQESRQALAQAPSLPEGHRAMGHIWNHRRNLRRALQDFHHAVDLDPRFTGALLNLGVNYLILGDLSRAEIYTRRAAVTDPQEPRADLNLATILLRQHRLAESREAARRTLALAPGRALKPLALEDLLLSYLWENNGAEVDRLAEEARRESEDDEQLKALRALAAAFAGRHEVGRRLLESVRPERISKNSVLVSLARAYLLLGDREAGLRALERASALDVVDLHELRTDPHLSKLAGEPRFEKIFTAQS